ncbi:hypothetical protein IWX64_003199 [Arthrobacter sp. CAN_A212]
MRFRLKDNAKSSIGNSLKSKAEARRNDDQEWADIWITVCGALEKALAAQEEFVRGETSLL